MATLAAAQGSGWGNTRAPFLQDVSGPGSTVLRLGSLTAPHFPLLGRPLLGKALGAGLSAQSMPGPCRARRLLVNPAVNAALRGTAGFCAGPVILRHSSRRPQPFPTYFLSRTWSLPAP